MWIMVLKNESIDFPNKPFSIVMSGDAVKEYRSLTGRVYESLSDLERFTDESSNSNGWEFSLIGSPRNGYMLANFYKENDDDRLLFNAVGLKVIFQEKPYKKTELQQAAVYNI
jgi:hypothetical protein